MDEKLNQLKLSIKNFWCPSAVNLPYIDDKLCVHMISNLMKVVLVKLWELLSENSSIFIQLHSILFSQQSNVKVIIYYLQLKHIIITFTLNKWPLFVDLYACGIKWFFQLKSGKTNEIYKTKYFFIRFRPYTYFFVHRPTNNLQFVTSYSHFFLIQLFVPLSYHVSFITHSLSSSQSNKCFVYS